jgi:hypothetical protein
MGEKKEKSPQGYDEDNASLDKFCKIKAKKEKHKVDQLQGGRREDFRISGTRARYYSRISQKKQAPVAPPPFSRTKPARVPTVCSGRTTSTAGRSLQDQARLLGLTPAAALGDLQQSCASGGLEDLLDTVACTGRALQVLVGTDLLADLLTLYT